MITHDPDHIGTSLAKLIELLKNKPRFAVFLSAFLSEGQELEEVFFQLFTDRRVDNAAGVNLDVIGRIVGQPRGNSADDDEYRARIKARVRANRSSGTIAEIYKVFSVLLPGVDLTLLQGFPAGFTLAIESVITSAYATLYASFLTDAKAAGVGAGLIWFPYPDAGSFTCESTVLFLNGDIGSGEDALYVLGSLTGWPTSGSIIIGEGTADEEFLDYVGYTGTLDGLILSASTTQPHEGGSAIALIGSPGLGFGDSTDASIGGALAGVIAS